MAAFLAPPGVVIDRAALTATKARDLVEWLRSDIAVFAHLLEVRHDTTPNERDVVVLDVDVELPQDRAKDIRRRERLAITFDPTDRETPEILALRSDFPWVRHLNLKLEEYPRSLCVFEEQYSQIRLGWTTVGFIERIREWLALTARDALHRVDQPLEAFLPDTGVSIVLPPDLATRASHDSLQPLRVTGVRGNARHMVLITEGPLQEGLPPDFVPHVATVVMGEPQPHGPIPRIPATLYELHGFLASAGVDLLGELRRRLRVWGHQPDRSLLRSHLIIVTMLPLTRDAGGTAEATSTMAFRCSRTLAEIGGAIGVWDTSPKDPKDIGTYIDHLAIFVETDLNQQGDDVPTFVLNTHIALSRSGAARLAGIATDERRVTAIGVGALGSQVYTTLYRMGWGRWTLIDEDALFPHNLARHALLMNAVGFSKATALQQTFSDILIENDVQAIDADVINPREQQTAVEQAVTEADILLDMSTSIPVARYLARDVASDARRASLFLNPAGTDSVLLVEDAERRVPLDLLEMQYYRALVREPEIVAHLHAPKGRIQYAHTCRDVSGVIPQDLVALHAALTARGLRLALGGAAASIIVWQTNDDGLAVHRRVIAVSPAVDHQANGWLIRTDQDVLSKIAATRASRLPNETGGVLIGTYDIERHTIYVVDVLPSPSDSTEWPKAYIRGCAGLKPEVQRITDATAGHLMYVGEWHSHPVGHGCEASATDRRAFQWLREHMEQDGFPALMLIVGERRHAWYVENISVPEDAP